jgi:hypothetical protein
MRVPAKDGKARPSPQTLTPLKRDATPPEPPPEEGEAIVVFSGLDEDT